MAIESPKVRILICSKALNDITHQDLSLIGTEPDMIILNLIKNLPAISNNNIAPGIISINDFRHPMLPGAVISDDENDQDEDKLISTSVTALQDKFILTSNEVGKISKLYEYDS